LRWPDLIESQDRPPPPPLKRATLVGDDRHVPRPKPTSLVAEACELVPCLEGGLLDRILGRHSLAEHGEGEPVSRFDQRRDQPVEAGVIRSLAPPAQLVGRYVSGKLVVDDMRAPFCRAALSC
jgi:hypothetical protein